MAKQAKSFPQGPSNPVHDYYEAIGAFGRFANGIQEIRTKGGDIPPYQELDARREKLLDSLRERENPAIASAVCYGGEQRETMSALVDGIRAACIGFKYPEEGENGCETHSAWSMTLSIVRGMHKLGQISAVVQMRIDLENKRVERTTVPETPPDSTKPRPRWDKDRRELWLGDTLCKRYPTRFPTNQAKILDAFEECGWPQRIDDPLDPGRFGKTLTELQAAVQGSPLSFGGDGTGRGVVWSIREYRVNSG